MPLENEKLKFVLDIGQLDQSRVYVAKTSGKRFLEFECIPTPNGRDGQTHFITQRQTKEERLEGEAAHPWQPCACVPAEGGRGSTAA